MLRLALPSLLALLVIAAPAAAGKTVYDFDGTEWTFPVVVSNLSGSAKGVGIPGVKTKGKGKEEHAMTVSVTGSGVSGTFTADWDNGVAEFTGTWTRKNECSKKLDLVFDELSEAALVNVVESTLVDIALNEGGIIAAFDTDPGTDLTKLKTKLIIKAKKKKNEATGKLAFNYAMTGEGEAEAFQVFNAPVKVKGKIKGTSDVQALTPLIVPTE